MVTPTLSALDDEAPLTEWALKIDVLMPDSLSRDLSQQGTVLGETGWFDLCLPTTVWFLCHAILESEAFRVVTGYNGEKVAIFEFCLDCFARD